MAASERRVPDQLLRHALERGEPVLSVKVQDDPDLEYAGSVAELNVEAFAAVPVTGEEGLQVVAYFDGPPPQRDILGSLQRLAPVFEDFGLLLQRARTVKERTERADAILSSLGGGEGPIIGSSRAVEDLRRLIHTIAPTDASVLVLGESGTGKELVARELHARSARCDGPMLSRSCAELTETLLESELFGHEKGAFTGAARDRAGLFEAASGGRCSWTRLARRDHVAEQAKLLRVIETGELDSRGLGESKTRTVDVRILSATQSPNSDDEVQATVASAKTCYFRLNTIRDPPPAPAGPAVRTSRSWRTTSSAASRRRVPQQNAHAASTHDALRARALARH